MSDIKEAIFILYPLSFIFYPILPFRLFAFSLFVLLFSSPLVVVTNSLEAERYLRVSRK